MDREDLRNGNFSVIPELSIMSHLPLCIIPSVDKANGRNENENSLLIHRIFVSEYQFCPSTSSGYSNLGKLGLEKNSVV